ncbi:MAG: hypothetical protein KDE51_04500 [Anaerolineales bacterium]|nr:hypothetical protein [Anaerolineales bacterium]
MTERNVQGMTLLDVWPTVVGFQAMQMLNRRWIRQLAEGGEVNRKVLALASEIVLDSVIPYVPVVTGTLSAAQQALMEEGADVIYITTMHLMNPLFDSFADEYAPEVLQRIDFYAEGVAQAMWLLEVQIYEQIEVELLA